MKIPDYYRQYQKPASNKTGETEKLKPDQADPKDSAKVTKQTEKISQAAQIKDKTVLFQGNGFTLNQLEDWEDKTLYTLMGPVTDGIQHNVIIDIEKNPPFETLEEYAEWHIKTLENELKSCMLLKKGQIQLTNGTEAYEAIFKWYPLDDLGIYQQQIYVMVEKIAFKMTASYTKKTRKTLGPQIERMMLSLNTDV